MSVKAGDIEYLRIRRTNLSVQILEERPDEPAAAGYARGGGRRRPDPGHDRSLGGARAEADREGIRSRRPLSARRRRADEGTRPVRRDDRAGIWRPRTVGVDLRQDRDEHLVGLDVDHRHHQFASDAGAGDPEIRHAAAEDAMAAEARDRRDPRRPCADRAGCRHRSAGHPHDREARRRSLRHQRHQDLDHQRRRGLLRRAAGEDQSGRAAAPQRHEPVHRAEAGRAFRSAASCRSSATRRSIPPSWCSRITACRPRI